MQLSERIYHHWLTARHIANLLEDPVEMIEQEALEDGWISKTVEHHIDYDDQGIVDAVLYDVRSIRMGTRIMIGVYLLMDIEERHDPLLIRADRHVDYISQWFPAIDRNILRAAVYRCQQLAYARDIQFSLQVHVQDALMIVAEAFCMERESLYNLAIEIAGTEENVFGFMVHSDTHLFRLVLYFSASIGHMLPEFECPFALQTEAVQ
jgi:hypothetical protein